ncbi:Protein of unknown function [Bacillus wiedmannii]|nr:Protein of unknown function [Bacillus wiedmannii]
MVQTHGMEMLSVRERNIRAWKLKKIEKESYELGFLKEEAMHNGTNQNLIFCKL